MYWTVCTDIHSINSPSVVTPEYNNYMNSYHLFTNAMCLTLNKTLGCYEMSNKHISCGSTDIYIKAGVSRLSLFGSIEYEKRERYQTNCFHEQVIIGLLYF